MNTRPLRQRITIAAAALMLSLSPATHAETYKLDKLHTQILFYVDHFGFSKSQGEFLDFEGEFDLDRSEIENSSVRITIYTESIDMDDDKWNRKMKGKSWLNTDAHPTIEFRSDRIEDLGEDKLTVHGSLTILGAARPVSLDMKLNKVGLNIASGKKTAGFSGGTLLRRSDFGMDSHLKYIGDEVEVRLEVEGAVPPFRKNDS